MTKAKLKTQPTAASVSQFLDSVRDPIRKRDSKVVLKLFEKVTGEEPRMWGPSIVGFGKFHYKRRDGSEHEFAATGFSPRKESLTLYILPGYKDYSALLKKLGPHKTSKSCLYIKDLSQIDLPTLKTLISKGYKDIQKQGKIEY